MPLILKEAICKVGGFDEKFPSSQDYDLWIRICTYYEVGYIKDPLVNYYVSNDAITRDIRKRISGWEMIEEKHNDLFINNKGSYNKFLNMISYQLMLNKYKKKSLIYFIKAIKIKKISANNLITFIKLIIVNIKNGVKYDK